MKKLTLIAVLLLVLGLSSGFALDLKPGLGLAGSVSVKWGVDLSDMSTGFENSSNADVTVTLLPADSTDTKTGSGAIYGTITLKDLELQWKDGAMVESTTPAASASIFIVPFQIDIGAPSMTANVIGPIEDIGNGVLFGLDVAIVNFSAIIDNENAFNLSTSYAGNGLDVKYSDASGLFWLQGDVKSETGIAANNNQAYALGAEGGVKVAPVDVSFGVFQGFNYAANPLAGYAQLGLTLEGIGSAKVGVDVAITGATVAWQLGGQVQMNFNKDATAYLIGKAIYDNTNHMDAVAGLTIPANTLMGPFTVTAAAYILDVLTANENSAYASLGYQVDLSDSQYVKFSGLAAFGLAAGGAMIANVSPQIEIGLAKAPLAKITLAYTSGNLLGTPIGAGTVSVAAEVDY